MKKFARFISLCLLLILSTETFAKAANPIEHASQSAEARLMMNALESRLMTKFSRASVAQKESILYGMYRLGVKVQNKVQKMDADKIVDKILKVQDKQTNESISLSDDEVAATEFMAEASDIQPVAPVTISASQVSRLIANSGEAIASVGTTVDSKGNFRALSKANFLDSVRVYYGDGDYSGMGEAIAKLFVTIFALLAIGAIVIVGLSALAFGLPGALVAVAILGVIVLVLLA